MIHAPEFYGNYQQRHLVAKQEKVYKEWPPDFAH
jgi:hypothetical protein